jgi:hypothetical protein
MQVPDLDPVPHPPMSLAVVPSYGSVVNASM